MIRPEQLVLVPRDGTPASVPAPYDPDRFTVAVVPGEAVLCRWLDLPAGRDAQVAAAAAFLLDDQIAQPREQVHVALGPVAPDGRRLVVLVERAQMRAWLDAVSGLPRLDALVPDCLLIPAPAGDEVLAVKLGEVFVVRGPERAATVEPDLLPLIARDLAPVVVDDPKAVEALIGRGLDHPVFDLRQGSFAPRREGAGSTWRLPALLAAAAAIAVLALPALQAARYGLATRSAEAEFKAAAGVTDGADAAARLGARLVRLQAGTRFAAQASAVLSAVERIEGMEVQSLLYDSEGAFRMTAAHTNYSDVEALRGMLTRVGLGVQESSAAQVDGRIVSDLVLRSAR